MYYHHIVLWFVHDWHNFSRSFDLERLEHSKRSLSTRTGHLFFTQKSASVQLINSTWNAARFSNIDFSCSGLFKNKSTYHVILIIFMSYQLDLLLLIWRVNFRIFRSEKISSTSATCAEGSILLPTSWLLSWNNEIRKETFRK